MAFNTFVGHQMLHHAAEVTHAATKPVGQALEIVAGMELPAVSELMHAGITGQLDGQTMQTILARHGVVVTAFGEPPTGSGVFADAALKEAWNEIFYAQQDTGTAVDNFTLTNRGYITLGQLDARLERLGFFDQGVRQQIASLRYEVPGPSDLVRFAVRHVFEPALVAELGYTAERNEGPFLLDIFHQAAGINYKIFSGPLAPTVELVTGQSPAAFVNLYAEAGLEEPTWADAFWWAHWVLPSPTQGYLMSQRFRPGRDTSFDPPETAGLEFSQADLNLLLRGNDYPPKFRPLLSGIARPLPGIRFIRQLVHFGIYTPANLLELFKRMGYSDRDANDLAKTVLLNEQDQANKGKDQALEKQVIEYARHGMISYEQAKQLLEQSGLDEDHVAKTLELATIADAVSRTKEFIASIKAAYTKGSLSHDEARTAMVDFGLVPQWIDEELNVWAWKVKTESREPTALQNVKYACEGLMTLAELSQRLTNLHYAPADVQLLVASAQSCQAQLAARAAAKAQAAKQAAARQLRQQQQQAAQAIRQARQALAQHGSPAQLRKWYCEGTLGSAELYDRLHQLGWPDADIARLIADCKQKRGSSGGPAGGAVAGNGARS